MTREEAIGMIKDDMRLHHDYLSGNYRKALRMAISALEQPEIIRCKECKEFRRWIDTDITFCDRTESEAKEDDFCSRAERREE